jgi:hypothetical protein
MSINEPKQSNWLYCPPFKPLCLYITGTIDNPEETRNADAARSLLIITLSPHSGENYTYFQDRVRKFNEEPPFEFFNPFPSYPKVVPNYIHLEYIWIMRNYVTGPLFYLFYTCSSENQLFLFQWQLFMNRLQIKKKNKGHSEAHVYWCTVYIHVHSTFLYFENKYSLFDMELHYDDLSLYDELPYWTSNKACFPHNINGWAIECIQYRTCK